MVGSQALRIFFSLNSNSERCSHQRHAEFAKQGLPIIYIHSCYRLSLPLIFIDLV